MRTIVIFIVSVAIICLLGVWIVPSFGTWLGQQPNRIGKHFENDMSVDEIVDIAHKDLAAATQKVIDLFAEVRSLKRDAQEVEKSLSGMKTQLAYQESILKKGVDLLKGMKHGEKVNIGGVDYTFSQLNKDIAERADTCRDLNEKIKIQTTDLANLRKIIADGNAKVNELTERIRHEKIQIDMDAARTKAYAAAVRLRTRAQRIYDADIDLGSGRRMLNERLERYEAEHAYLSQMGINSGGTINTWDNEVGIGVAVNGIDAAKSYFQSKQSEDPGHGGGNGLPEPSNN